MGQLYNDNSFSAKDILMRRCYHKPTLYTKKYSTVLFMQFSPFLLIAGTCMFIIFMMFYVIESNYEKQK